MNQASSYKNIRTDKQNHIPASVNTVLINHFLKRYLLIALLFVNTISVFSQVDRTFWFAIPKETNAHGCIGTDNFPNGGSPNCLLNDVSFKITAQSLDANVRISKPADPSFVPILIFVPAGTTVVRTIASNWAQFATWYANPAAIGAVVMEGTSNNGVLITSDNDITVYYDYDNYWNRDLFSLKGSNAMGTTFFTPFQYIWSNGSYPAQQPYSSINVVASMPGTIITVTLPAGLALLGHAAGSTFTLPTLGAGQTYTLVANSQAAANHPAGVRIVSNNPIAVTTNDDSSNAATGGCRDINGDQIVPTNVIGKKYVVMVGNYGTAVAGNQIQDAGRAEQVIVVSTQAATTVKYYDKKGNLLRTSPVLGMMGKDYISPNRLDTMQSAIYISANKPIYVYHVTGVGCEIGGAILPPITDCTGSNTVTFYRSNTVTDLTLNLMIPYDRTIPFSASTQSFKFFTITYQNGTSQPIPDSWFEAVDSAGWVVLKMSKRGITNAFIPPGQAVTISNTRDFFHLGIVNGTSGQTDKYGYFSSFNAARAAVRVSQSEEQAIKTCFGDTVILVATGGLEYTWHYGSPDGSDYRYISNIKSPTPQVYCPPGIHNFYAIIRQAKCFGDDTLVLQVKVYPEVKAAFEATPTIGCSPISALFKNTSKGADRYTWSRKIDNGTETVFVPSSPLSFTESPLENKTAPYLPKNYTYKLRVSIGGACPDSLKQEITVFPEIKAHIFPPDTIGCHPVIVNFRNNSNGNVTDSSYFWNFGDGNTSIIKVPSHEYDNYYTIKDTTYNAMMVATSPYLCRDTARTNITVHPYIKAGFTVDTVKGCSPFFIKIYNNSQNRKAISKYFWDFNYKNPAVAPRDTLTTGDKDTLYHSYPRNLTNAPIVYKVLLTVYHNFGTGCPDTISRIITVYPEGKVTILTPDTVGCNKLTVNFRALADPGVTQYIWDFDDDGTSNIANPTHQFIGGKNGDSTYTVTVITSSAQNCAGYDTMKVLVHAQLNPVFSIDVPRTCAPYNAIITNKSTGGITNFNWDFGDGTTRGTSGASSFTHPYRNTTLTEVTYTVKLIVANIGGCKDSVSQNISLYPEVNAGFTTTFGSYCSPRQVDFVNNSSATATKFIWKFGDNSTSLARDTTHYYTNNTMRDTIYYAYLIAISDYNCKDSMKSQPILIYPYIEPYFSIDTTIGCNPLTAKIINGSLGPYIEDFWNFGSGANVGPQPKTFSHVFQNTGTVNKTFNIKLQVSYKGICQKPYNKQVTVYPSVIPKVSANRTTVCSNSEIAFRDSSHFTNVAYNYRWDYGDGSTLVNTYPANKSLTEVTKHKYENFGFTPLTPKVILTTYSQRGCQADTTINIVIFPNVKASFSFDDAAGCSPVIVPLKEGSTSIATWKRFWDDEKTPSIGFPYTYLPPSITYRNDTSTTNKIFKPKLKVAYLYNGSPVCPDSITRTVTVYPKVTAYFAAKDSFKICQPDTVNFANGSRIGNYRLLLNDNRLTYKWTFGDNGSSSDYEPRHNYYNYDYYRSLVDTVWLKVVSQVGNCRDSLRKIVTIYPKPVANFDITDPKACPPFKVRIDHISKAEGGSMYNWSFNGIGNDTITRVPFETLYHVFTNSGSTTLSHPINLLVTTPHNCTDTTSQRIYVWPPVIADFDKDTAGCHQFNVTFINKSQQSDSWYWDFGEKNNISISKAKSPSHTFLNNSLNDTTYTVFLRAVSKVGCHDSITKKVTVYPQPIANFEADRYYFTYSPSANVVNFTNLSNDGYWNYHWDYDDLREDNIKGPTSHEFYLGAPHWGGQFNVKLNVWSNHCSDSISHRITIVAPKPIADFSISENGCVPLAVSFTELTSYGTSWLWEFGDGGTYSGQNPPPYTYYRAGKFNIKLTVTGDGGVSYAFKDVEVYPKPSVNFDLKPNLADIAKIPDNDGTLVWGAKISFYNECGLGEKFLWDFGDSLKSIELAPSHIYKNVGVYTVKLGAWTVHQCYDEIIKKDTIKILGIHKCEFPNAFTPDISGQNDGTYDIKKDTKNYVFHPSWAGVVDYHLEIYDRWGEKLFESNDVTIGWNGYYKGKLCKTDVYIWKATGKYTDGGTFEKAGNVTLLR